MRDIALQEPRYVRLFIRAASQDAKQVFGLLPTSREQQLEKCQHGTLLRRDVANIHTHHKKILAASLLMPEKRKRTLLDKKKSLD